MAEDVHPEIAAALAKLAKHNAAAVGDADAALDWLTHEQGLTALTQERVQDFCWYQLPMKWLISYDEKVRVATALAEALDLLQLPRYAAVCRSEATREILTAYEESPQLGKAAYRRAAIASGIYPPDLPELEWGQVMGVQEVSAWSSVADFLEMAVASGQLVPGARGWKTRQQELVRAHINISQTGLLGQTFAHAILTERTETWVNLRHSETRRQIVAALANSLLHPANLPEGTTDPLPRVRWLLAELDEGVVLTQTGNLNRKLVQQSVDMFGWDFPNPPRSEDEFFDLYQVHTLVKKLGLARRKGRMLTLTAKGRSLLTDPDELWRTVATRLLPRDNDFALYTGELFLALLVSADSVPLREIRATIHQAVREEGFGDSLTGLPPDEDDVSWAMHVTLNLTRALGLLAVGADWQDRDYGLSEVGKATALEALRSRATGS
ncbi:MAG: hypothetical protein J2P28_21030, partial [Actinobacteria bacterium]|nr:hypothetical protein [Actinomycetota bacterium]